MKRWLKAHWQIVFFILFLLLVALLFSRCATYEGARNALEAQARQKDIELCKRVSSNPEDCEKTYNK